MASIHLAAMRLESRAPPLEAPNVTAAEKCARPVADETGAPVFPNGSMTLHQLMVYISIVCTIVTILVSVFSTWRHLRRYTVPQEQRQIIRIVNLPVFYSVFNLLALIWYQYYLYIQPITGIYEAFTVAAMFLLVLEYVAPDGTDRDNFFHKLEAKDRRGNVIPGGSLRWYHNTWASCFQYPLTKLVFTVIEIITQYFDVYCENSFSPKHVHLWLQLLDWFLIGGALGSCARFVRRFRNEQFVDPKHKMRPKFFSFTGIIIFQIIQDLIFRIMNGKLFSPGQVATWNDLNFGLPSFLTCIESVIFSFIFLWTFSSSEYKNHANRYGTGAAQRITTLRAIWDALNLSDIFAGIVVAIQLLFARITSRQRSTNSQDRSRNKALLRRNRMQGYSQNIDSRENSPSSDTHYQAGVNLLPTRPNPAHDPSAAEWA